MRSMLKDGKIPIPASVSWALTRHRSVSRAIAEIEHSLPTLSPILRGPAVKAHCYLSEERRQLGEWIESRPEVSLLGELHVALRRILHELSPDVDPEEWALLARLRAVTEGGVVKEDQS